MKRYLIFSVMLACSAQVFADAQFDALPGPGLIVSFVSVAGAPRVGVKVVEKTSISGDKICDMMTPVVLHPIPSYQCYGLGSEGAEAKADYESLGAEPLRVVFTTFGGGRLADVNVTQKDRSHGFCRVYYSMIPDVAPTYRCYTSLDPL